MEVNARHTIIKVLEKELKHNQDCYKTWCRILKNSLETIKDQTKPQVAYYEQRVKELGEALRLAKQEAQG